MPYYGVINGGTGYIHLSSFIDKSPAAVRAILEQFQKNPELKTWCSTCSGNGGGLLEAAVDIVSPTSCPKARKWCVPATRTGLKRSTRQPDSLFPDIPLAAYFIDGGTASSSEIVAGAIQDLDRGVLVGTRSFGKGLVQTTRPLPYSGLLKVTVAKYYTPSGRLIQALDYAHRNEDGSVEPRPRQPHTRIQDPPRTHHARRWRPPPDSVVDWGKINRIVYKRGTRQLGLRLRHQIRSRTSGNCRSRGVRDHRRHLC